MITAKPEGIAKAIGARDIVLSLDRTRIHNDLKRNVQVMNENKCVGGLYQNNFKSHPF
jgi:hypothetical protein